MYWDDSDDEDNVGERISCSTKPDENPNAIITRDLMKLLDKAKNPEKLIGMRIVENLAICGQNQIIGKAEVEELKKLEKKYMVGMNSNLTLANQLSVRVYASKIQLLATIVAFLAVVILYGLYLYQGNDPVGRGVIFQMVSGLAVAVLVVFCAMNFAESLQCKLNPVGDNSKHIDKTDNIKRTYFPDKLKKERLRLIDLYITKLRPAIIQVDDMYDSLHYVQSQTPKLIYTFLLGCFVHCAVRAYLALPVRDQNEEFCALFCFFMGIIICPFVCFNGLY